MSAQLVSNCRKISQLINVRSNCFSQRYSSSVRSEANKGIVRGQKEHLNFGVLDASWKRQVRPHKEHFYKTSPWSPLITGTKAILLGWFLAATASILYGAYDTGYRRTLRRDFPWGAQILDLVMEEEEASTREEVESKDEAAHFRNEIQK